MRRPLGYVLSVVTGYLMARHLHSLDVHWGWYQGGPGASSDDPLALCLWVGVSALGCWVVHEVTPGRR